MKYQLAQQGWVHPEEVLQELSFENPKETLKRAQEAVQEGLIKLGKGQQGGATGGSTIPLGEGDIGQQQ